MVLDSCELVELMTMIEDVMLKGEEVCSPYDGRVRNQFWMKYYRVFYVDIEFFRLEAGRAKYVRDLMHIRREFERMKRSVLTREPKNAVALVFKPQPVVAEMVEDVDGLGSVPNVAVLSISIYWVGWRRA